MDNVTIKVLTITNFRNQNSHFFNLFTRDKNYNNDGLPRWW